MGHDPGKFPGKEHQVPSIIYPKIKATNKKRHSRSSCKKHFPNIHHPPIIVDSFRILRKMQKRPKLNLKSNNRKDYNQPFSLSELTDYIMKSHNTAVSPHEIRYKFL